MCQPAHRPVLLHPIRFLSILVALLVVCDAWCPPLPIQVSRPDSKLLAKPKGKASNNKNKDNKDAVVAALVHSHHLLDHKPDNLVLKGGKYKLRGVACLGTPGVALCIGTTPSITKFKASLEKAMPQKRFKTKILQESFESSDGDEFSGFGQVSLGEFRAVLASMGHEAEFSAVTGIAPETAAVAKRSSDDETPQDGGGRSSKKKKRKRK